MKPILLRLYSFHEIANDWLQQVLKENLKAWDLKTVVCIFQCLIRCYKQAKRFRGLIIAISVRLWLKLYEEEENILFISIVSDLSKVIPKKVNNSSCNLWIYLESAIKSRLCHIPAREGTIGLILTIVNRFIENWKKNENNINI